MIVKDDNAPDKLAEGERAVKFSDVVKFDFKYPKDYPATKKRHMTEGVIELHRLQAEDFEKRGFGKIVK